MATTVEISSQDVSAASNILEQFLSDQIEEGDFTKGTALRDLTIGAIASIFAFLRAQNTEVRQLQSLNAVQAATSGDPEALRDAVAGILSNVFIALKGGSRARGSVVGHLSSLTDVFVPTTSRFIRSGNLIFTVDSTETYFVSRDELVPIVDSDGLVLEYQFRIPLVAAKTGVDYNIAPGLFSSFDRFNAFVTRIENPELFAGGKGPETVSEVLERAPTAIAVRNLINDRSIQAVLNDNFGDSIRGIFVAGMGMAEMQRDRALFLTTNLQLHVGGMTDIYLLQDLVETTFTGIVGDYFLRPDGLATVFRDDATDFTDVQAGDILRVTAGLKVVPAEFLVITNAGTELFVSEKAPFPTATDEVSASVTYTIGRIGPIYNDVVSGTGGVGIETGATSRRVKREGRVTLPGGPVMDILDVALLDPPLAESAYKDSLDGFIHFTDHVNGVPANILSPGAALQFATVVNNPLQAQSALQWMEIRVGTDDNSTRYDGSQLRIRYRTLAGFSAVDTFVRSRRERTSAASQLPRGHHPVVVQINIVYKLKRTAIALLSDAAIVKTVVDFINSFDTTAAPLDASAIDTLLRTTYPTMAAVLPFSIDYTLAAPTGELVSYSTSADPDGATCEVRLDPLLQTDGPVLDLESYGVTDRTVRYLANNVSITAQRFVAATPETGGGGGGGGGGDED
jgi:hypothetical protein